MMFSSALQILAGVALAILAARVCGWLAARLTLPVVLGELLAGVLLGPTFLDFWARAGGPAVQSSVTPQLAIRQLAFIGVILLMFAAGLETDLAMLRNAFAPAFWAAAGGVALPMLGGTLVSLALHLGWLQSLFIGAILCATSVTITAQTLLHAGQMRSRVGSTILGAAVIDDVLGLIALSLVIALGAASASGHASPLRALAVAAARLIVFLATVWWLGGPFTRWIFRSAAKISPRFGAAIAGVLVAVAFAFHASWTGGMAAITGAYLAGLYVAALPEHRAVLATLHPAIKWFFGPLFFVSIGLEVDARVLAHHGLIFVLLFAIAVAGKVLGSGAGAYFNKLGAREALIVGVGMIPRGEVGLIAANIGWTAGIVTRDIYVQMLALVLATTLVTPLLLRFAFPKDNLAEAIAAAASLDHVAENLPEEIPDAPPE